MLSQSNRFPGTLEQLKEAARGLGPYLPLALAPLGVYGLYKCLCYMVPGPHHQPTLKLKDRTVLITGASSGLGRELAFEFYSKGAKVILTARSIDKLQELCDELEDMGRMKGWQNPYRPSFRYLDLAELNGDGEHLKQVDDLLQLAIDGKTIDVLVNNAGVSNRGSCVDTPLRVQRQLMEVNYFGHVAITRALLSSIPDDGAIVTISSMQGRVAMPYRSAYSASKHALTAFMDSMRGEERHQLQLLVVSAGYINTGFGSRALNTAGRPVGYEDPNQLKGLHPETAAKRIVQALVNRKTELILAPLTHRLLFLLRLFAPNLMWHLLYKRAKREQAITPK